MLLLPVAALVDDHGRGLRVIEAPFKVEFFHDFKTTGEKWAVVFTDEEALRGWDTLHPFIGLDARLIFKMMIEKNFDLLYINLFHDKQVRVVGWLTRTEIEMLAAGTIPDELGSHHARMKLQREAELTVSSPANQLRDDVINALTDIAVKLRGLKEIWYFGLSINGGPVHDALGVRCTKGIFSMSPDKIIRTLMTRVQPLLLDGQTLDVIVLERIDDETSRHSQVLWRRA